MRSKLAEATGPITIRINSPGGNLLAALTVYDALVEAGPERIEALVAGACGSAATLILCAADRRRMIEGSRLWVHAASTCAWGNAAELRRHADELDTLLPRMARAYERVCPAAQQLPV